MKCGYYLPQVYKELDLGIRQHFFQGKWVISCRCRQNQSLSNHFLNAPNSSWSNSNLFIASSFIVSRFIYIYRNENALFKFYNSYIILLESLKISTETLQFSFYGSSQPPGASLYWLIFSPLLYTELITSKHNRIYICTHTNRKLLVLS